MCAKTLWRTSVHEAAHGCFALKHGAAAVELTATLDGGLCSPIGLPRLAGFDEATFSAVGAAGSRLARFTKPPQKQTDRPTAAPPPYSMDAEGIETCKARAIADIRRSTPDAVIVAQWACLGVHGIEEHPHEWPRRARRVHAAARLFVRQHRDEILEIARSLYATGFVKIPNQEEGKQ
jgi:hypothetical protein